MKEYTITKRVSKQGKNNILVIPKVLENKISHKDVVEVKIKLIEKFEE